MHHMNDYKTWQQLQKNAESCIKQVLEATLKKKNNSSTATDHPSRKLSKLDEPDMQNTIEELRMNS